QAAVAEVGGGQAQRAEPGLAAGRQGRRGDEVEDGVAEAVLADHRDAGGPGPGRAAGLDREPGHRDARPALVEAELGALRREVGQREAHAQLAVAGAEAVVRGPGQRGR
ncbi:MAG: hypothetical protein ACK559_18240, partial [bacterium]